MPEKASCNKEIKNIHFLFFTNRSDTLVNPLFTIEPNNNPEMPKIKDSEAIVKMLVGSASTDVVKGNIICMYIDI